MREQKLNTPILSSFVTLLALTSLVGCGGKNGNPVHVGRVVSSNPGGAATEPDVVTEQVLHAQTLVAAVASNLTVAGKPATGNLALPDCKKVDDQSIKWETGNGNCGAWDKAGKIQAKAQLISSSFVPTATSNTEVNPNVADKNFLSQLTSNIDLNLKVAEADAAKVADFSATSGSTSIYIQLVRSDAGRTYKYYFSNMRLNTSAHTLVGTLTATVTTAANLAKTEFEADDFTLALNSNDVVGMKMDETAIATRTSANGKMKTTVSLESDEDVNSGFILLAGSRGAPTQIQSGQWKRRANSGAEEKLAITKDGYKSLAKKKVTKWKCTVAGFCAGE